MLSPEDIRALLLPEVYFTFEKFAAMHHEGSWADVAAKAKRLVQQGKVTILRNAPHHIMAHVIGDGSDNGGQPDEHDVEISRHDPNSQLLEQWNCDCAWAQFAFDRTRKWKKFEGRPCWFRDQMVSMADGSFKPIQDVQVGEHVLTDNGVGEVTATWATPYDGDLVSIWRVGSNEPMKLTRQHKVISTEPAVSGRSVGTNWEETKSSVYDSATWTEREAQDIEPGMWLRMRYVAEIEDTPLQTDLPVDLDLDERLLILAGYYLAGGSIENNHGIVAWTLHRDEIHISDRLEAALEAINAGELKRYFHGNSLICRVSNAPLASVLAHLCGVGSRTKRLSRELMLLPPEKQRILLSCYLEGDGCTHSDSSISATTASDVLARQLVTLGARTADYIPSRAKMKNSVGSIHRDADNLTANRVEFYRGHMKGRLRLEDGYYAARVSKVSKEHYSGTVYNLTVSPQHTVAVEEICCPQCSHVLATYWKARSTPLDLSEYDQNYQVPRGQKGMPGQQSIPGMPFAAPDTEQRHFTPEEEGQGQAQEDRDYPSPGEREQGPPEDTGAAPRRPGPKPGLPHTDDLTLPKQPETPFSNEPKAQPQPQHEQLHLFDITAPPGMQPNPSAPPVSVPGGRPPTPGNPIAFPGTFSHFVPIISLRAANFIYASDALTDYFEVQRDAHQPIYVTLKNLVTLELSGGKIPTPGAMPYGASSEGVPMYKVLELGYNPATGVRENADVNVLQGAPEQTGTYADVSPGRRGEVLDFDPNLKMAYLVVPLNYPEGGDARLHPHALKGWVDYADIKPAPRGLTPWRKKTF